MLGISGAPGGAGHDRVAIALRQADELAGRGRPARVLQGHRDGRGGAAVRRHRRRAGADPGGRGGRRDEQDRGMLGERGAAVQSDRVLE